MDFISTIVVVEQKAGPGEGQNWTKLVKKGKKRGQNWKKWLKMAKKGAKIKKIGKNQQNSAKSLSRNS